MRSFLSGKMAAVLGGRKIGLKAKAFTPQVRRMFSYIICNLLLFRMLVQSCIILWKGCIS